MKKLMIVAAAVALFAGCGENEAKKFGYKGADLADDDKMFFTTGPTVTNWVPARVLSVCEEYPMSPEESALIAAAGVIAPGEPLEKVPEGYVKETDEPWFAMWRKESENLGRKGVNGFISHWNEDKKVWETSETYFSSYYPDEAGALAALAETRKIVGKKFSPKKFYDFDKCWVAEYLRLRVMCLVGQKPDGTWSCMLDINDKNRAGCGQWEPPEAQAERLAEYKYRKAMIAWKAEKSKVIAANHEAVEKIRAERGLAPLGEGFREFEAEDGRKASIRFCNVDAASATNRVDFWKERVAALTAATGVKFEAEPVVEEIPSGYVGMSAQASNDIYDVRLTIAFPPSAEAEEAQPEPEKAEAEVAQRESEKPEGEAAENEPAPKPPVEWQEVCIEKMMPGFAIPPRPQPPQR